MKKTTRILALLLCLVLLFSVSVYAGDTEKEEREQTREYVEASGSFTDSYGNKYSTWGYSTVLGNDEAVGYLQFTISRYAQAENTVNDYTKYLYNFTNVTFISINNPSQSFIKQDNPTGASGSIQKRVEYSGKFIFNVTTTHQATCKGGSWTDTSRATPLV